MSDRKAAKKLMRITMFWCRLLVIKVQDQEGLGEILQLVLCKAGIHSALSDLERLLRLLLRFHFKSYCTLWLPLQKFPLYHNDVLLLFQDKGLSSTPKHKKLKSIGKIISQGIVVLFYKSCLTLCFERVFSGFHKPKTQTCLDLVMSQEAEKQLRKANPLLFICNP